MTPKQLTARVQRLLSRRLILRPDVDVREWLRMIAVDLGYIDEGEQLGPLTDRQAAMVIHCCRFSAGLRRSLPPQTQPTKRV